MKMRRLATICTLLIYYATIQAQVVYTPTDSTIAVDILRQDYNGTVAIASRLLNTPYVAGTIDKDSIERLTVNLREFDCTTFVDQVTALAITKSAGKSSFDDFCSTLRLLRYRDGACNSYSDRLHYISWWIEECSGLGLIKEVRGEAHTATQLLNLNFMSKHPKAYKMLQKNPGLIKEIEKQEEPFRNIQVAYIPKKSLNGNSKELNINDGDILALVTAINGLDVSHIGFALWKDGRLHLIHASSIKGETIIDEQSLFDYMKEKKKSLGVRVFRINEKGERRNRRLH